MDNPAPVITITNPSAPLEEPTDVLDKAAPSRRSQGLSLLLALLLVLSTAGVVELVRRHHEQVAAAKAVAAVALEEYDDSDFVPSDHTADLDLANSGPDPVSLVSVQVPGYPVLLADPMTVNGHDNQLVTVRLNDFCPTAITGLTQAEVTVRTAHGDRVTRRIALAPTNRFVQGYSDTMTRRCGLYPVARSLAFTVETPGVGRTSTTIPLALTNLASKPRTITGVRVGGGLSWTSPQLPLTLPPGGAAHLSISFTVSDCQQARLVWEQGTGVMRLVLAGDGTTATVPIEDENEDVSSFLSDRAIQTCDPATLTAY